MIDPSIISIPFFSDHCSQIPSLQPVVKDGASDGPPSHNTLRQTPITNVAYLKGLKFEDPPLVSELELIRFEGQQLTAQDQAHFSQAPGFTKLVVN